MKSGQKAAQIRYEEDFYGWAKQQAKFLRSGETGRLDLANLADEIEVYVKAKDELYGGVR